MGQPDIEPAGIDCQDWVSSRVRHSNGNRKLRWRRLSQKSEDWTAVELTTTFKRATLAVSSWYSHTPPLLLRRFSFGLLSQVVTEGISYIYNNPTMKSSAQAGVLLSLATSSLAAYDLVKTYSGNSFFDSWSYYGHYDNLTSGVQLSYRSYSSSSPSHARLP